MDKKNFIFGVTCLVLAMFLIAKQEKDIRILHTDSVENTVTPLPVIEKEAQKKPIAVHKFREQGSVYTIENDAIRVSFTDNGGAISNVFFKKYKVERDIDIPYCFNQQSDVPALDLSFDGDFGENVNYSVTKKSDDFIRFIVTMQDGTEIVRGYKLSNSSNENPYLINHETVVKQKNYTHNKLYVNLGMFKATFGDKYHEYLNFGAYDGKNAEFVKTSDFEASNGFLGLGKREGKEEVSVSKLIHWGSIKNQFFTAILTPLAPAIGYVTMPSKIQIEGKEEQCIHGQLVLGLPSQSSLLSMKYYVGPKDYLLLNKMGDEQDLVMQFGFFGGISKILLLTMRCIHSVIPNWGWTIILLTFIVKLLMWPLTQAQFRSSKRMASIQKPLKEIREKFKGNPQKLQSETMKLFKMHKVNPAMGCLPLFIQLPIFLGLYFMLRTSSEMRFQSFLWIKDLSIADTVAYIGGFPVNILPLLMGITMFFQMKLTPTPTMDSAQQKMLTFMPFIFLIFCYSFPSALVLYWTVQNIFTILQQWLTNGKEEITLKS